MTTIGSVDQDLGGDVKDMLEARNKIEIVGNQFNPLEISDANQSKYKGELYTP